MNYKHLFFTSLLAASFGLVACDNSSSAESSDDNSSKKSTDKKQDVISDAGQTYCNVTTTANSVTVSMALEGEATYTSTVTDGGSRYKTISSEYWYASSSDANSECEDQKEEATHWKDGSYQVSCSGNRIYISEIDEGTLRDHETNFRDLCRQFEERYGSSTGKNNSTTNGNKNSNAEFKCDVSRTDNSVTTLFSYKNFIFETTVSLIGTGADASTVSNSKNTYPNKARAEYECESMKRMAAGYPEGSYQISCSDKTVSMITMDEGDEAFIYLNGYVDDYCESLQDAYDKGKLDDMYEGFFGI